MCIMKYILNRIAPENSFSQKLNDLMIKYPSVDPNALGFKLNWQDEPLWKWAYNLIRRLLVDRMVLGTLT